METVFLPLDGDAETHGVVFGGGPAWQAIDENPHDSDTTRIRIDNAFEVEASTIDASDLPEGVIVSAVKVHWAAAGTGIVGDPSFGRAGLRIGGIDYWATARDLSPNVYGGTFVETWAANPATGLPWLRGAVAVLVPLWETTYQPADFGWPRLTQRILSVEFELTPVRHDATGQSLAPAAHITGLAPSGGSASLAPEATGLDLSPEAAPVGLGPSAQGAGLADSGDTTSRAPMASAANIHELTATPSSLAPQASGVAIAPEATGAALAPGGTEESE